MSTNLLEVGEDDALESREIALSGALPVLGNRVLVAQGEVNQSNWCRSLKAACRFGRLVRSHFLKEDEASLLNADRAGDLTDLISHYFRWISFARHMVLAYKGQWGPVRLNPGSSDLERVVQESGDSKEILRLLDETVRSQVVDFVLNRASTDGFGWVRALEDLLQESNDVDAKEMLKQALEEPTESSLQTAQVTPESVRCLLFSSPFYSPLCTDSWALS